MKPRRDTSGAPLWWPLMLVGVGLLVAVLGAVWQQRANDALVRQRLQATATYAADQVARRMRLYEYGLLGARSAVLVAGNAVEEVSRAHFRRFAASQDIARQYPGVVGFAFARRVPAGGEAAFLAGMRRQGFEGVQLYQTEPHEGDRFIVEFVEPLEANTKVLGHDIASEPRRRQAIEDAIRTAEPRMTAPLTLVQTPDQVGRSVLLYLAAYRSVVPLVPARRDGQTFGMVTASLRMDTVLHDLDDDGSFALALTDSTQPGEVQRFYSTPTWRGDAEAWVNSATLELYGRQWRVEVQALQPFVQRLNLRSPGTVAATVLMVSGLLALLLAGRLRAAQRERVIALERAQTAAVVEGSHDAIVRHTPQGRVLGWNAAAQRLLGWRADEALYRDLLELTVPPQRREEARQMLQRVQAGEDVPPFDTVRLYHQRRMVDVSLSVSPIRDAGSRVAAAATTMRDIRAQRAAQQRILRTNALLKAALQQLGESEAQARHTAALLEQLIESAPDPIWTKDAAGRWSILNSAAAAVIGRPRESVVGLRNGDVLPAQQASVLDAQDQHILHEGAVLRTEDRFFDAGRGEPRVFYSIKAPLRAADGRITGLLGIARDITERKAAEAALAKFNATLEQQVRQRTAELQLVSAREHAIVTSAGSAIVTTDLSGVVTSVNPAAATLLRTTAVQAAGCSILAFYDADELQSRGQALPAQAFEHGQALPQPLQMALQRRDALPGESGQRSEWTFVRADGTRFPGLLSVTVLRDEPGDAIGFLVMVADLSERRRMEDELRQRTRQAEAASQAKSAFLAHMSHELRTPLNAVIGLSQLLAQMSLTERALGFVRHIEQAGDQLLALVNDVLDLSRIEAGELRMEVVPFELRSLLGAVRAMVQSQADAKELALRLDVPADVPGQLMGDPLRLRQVLLNLLSNAVKFMPTGSVVLGVRETARGEGRATLRFDVTDTGIGIAPEQQERIFEPFTQADGYITRRFGGTGLGLSIVQRLVRMMDGELMLRSAPGKGTTVSATLRFELAGPPDGKAPSAPA